MLWTEILSGNFEKEVERSGGVCVMVVGCVEHHGKHLPLGQDVISTDGVAMRAAEIEPFVMFPSLYFGEKQGAGEFPGTIIFSSKLISDILTEACDEMGRNGFKKIVLLNGHGGNENLLRNFARSTLYTKKDYMVFVYSFWNAWPRLRSMLAEIDKGQRHLYPELTDADIEVLHNFEHNSTAKGHGCLRETAITLGIRPDLVDLTRLNDVDGRDTKRLKNVTDAGFYTPFAWMSSFPNSLQSDAHDGNNERIGRTLVKYAAKKLAGAIKVLKNDTACEEYHKEWCEKQK